MPRAASSACPASTPTSMPARTAGPSRASSAFYDVERQIPRRSLSPSAQPDGCSPIGRCRTAASATATRIAADRSSATPWRWDRRFLDLYAATGDRDWLTSAAKAGDFVASFRTKPAASSTSKTVQRQRPVCWQSLQSSSTTRSRSRTLPEPAQSLQGRRPPREQASHAMRYLSGASTEMPRPLPGVLLADEELALEPTHITIVGHKDDARAQTSACHRARAARPLRTSGWNGSIRVRASCPIPTSIIPTSASPRRLPVATASARSRRSMPRN